MTTPGSHGPGEQPPSGGPGWGPPAGSPQPGPSQYGAPQSGSAPPPPGQYPGQGFPPQQQPSRGGAGKWVAIAGGILAIVVIAILAFAFAAGGDPEVGDC